MMLHSPLEETDSYYFTVYNIYKDFIICGSEGKEIKEHENKTDTSMYFLSVTINYSSLANIFLVQWPWANNIYLIGEPLLLEIHVSR